MFDFGLGELLLVGVVALIVLGPERLPQAARTAGRLVGKLQGFVNNVKQELNTQAELDELVIVGDVDAKQTLQTAAKLFGDIPAKVQPPRNKHCFTRPNAFHPCTEHSR